MASDERVSEMNWNTRGPGGPSNPFAKVREKPVATVRIGIYLLGVTLVLFLMQAAVSWAKYPGWSINDPSTNALKSGVLVLGFVAIAVMAAVAILLLYKAYRGQVWALVLLVVLNALDLLGVGVMLFRQGIGSSASYYEALIYNVCRLIAICLLLIPPSLSWFKRRNSDSAQA